MHVEAESLERLRRRTSEKWRAFPPDVLPLFVAEMDYPLAPAIAQRLHELIDLNDSGYAHSASELGLAFAGFAERHWGWRLDPSKVRMTTDVSVAIVETLRRVISPGDGVIISSPVYSPFYDLITEAGGIVVDVPMRRSRDGGWGLYELDVPGIRDAFAAGARATIISNPHNPLGLVHPRETLAALAAAAAEHEAWVVSDEIHGPLVHDASHFVPFLSVSDAARDWGVAVTSASKAFNLAGFKCAVMVATSDRALAVLDGMYDEVTFRTSIVGMHASIAAFTSSDEWLEGALAAIGRSSALLTELLAEHFAEVRFRPPVASYLAWLDFSELGWGDDPSQRALDVAGVALNSGLTFGSAGAGFARLNLACSPEVLTEAVHRLAAAR